MSLEEADFPKNYVHGAPARWNRDGGGTFNILRYLSNEPFTVGTSDTSGFYFVCPLKSKMGLFLSQLFWIPELCNTSISHRGRTIETLQTDGGAACRIMSSSKTM
jgi:hypothetical protein